MDKVVLVGCSGVHEHTQIDVENNVVIGRDQNHCQIVYLDPETGVGDIHCRLQNINGMVNLIDLGTEGGTYLENGTKLAPNIPVMLQNGQRFYLANRENSFEIRIEEMPNTNVNSRNKIILGVAAAVVVLIAIACAFSAYTSKQKAEEAQLRLEEEQNKSAVDKTVDAIDGWMDLFE
jgi:pSer/pThr/pTyr-binding forkhead associated (FHA) protein